MKLHPLQTAAWVVSFVLFLVFLPHFIPKTTPTWWVMQPVDHQRESSIFSGLELPFWKYPTKDTWIFQSNADLTKPGPQTIQIHAALHDFSCKNATSQPCGGIQVISAGGTGTTRITFANNATYQVKALCGTGKATLSNHLCTHAFSAWGVFLTLVVLVFIFPALNVHQSHLTSALRTLMLTLAWTTAGYGLEVLSSKQTLQELGWSMHFSGIILTNLAFMNLSLQFGEIKRLKVTITAILLLCAMVTLFVYLVFPEHTVYGLNHQEVGLPYQPLHVEYKLLHAIFDNAANGFMLFMLMFNYRYWSLLHPLQRQQAVMLTLCAALPTSLAGIVWIFGWGSENTGQDVAFLVRALGTALLLAFLIRNTNIHFTPPQHTLKLTSPHPTLIFNFKTQHLLNANSSAKLLLDLPTPTPPNRKLRHFWATKPPGISELTTHPIMKTLLDNLKKGKLFLQLQQESFRGYRIVPTHHPNITVVELVDQSHLQDPLTSAGSTWAFQQRIKHFPNDTVNCAVLVIRIHQFDQFMNASYETVTCALQHVASCTLSLVQNLDEIQQNRHPATTPSDLLGSFSDGLPGDQGNPDPHRVQLRAGWWTAIRRELREVFVSEVSLESHVLESKHFPLTTTHLHSLQPSSHEFYHTFGDDFILLLSNCSHRQSVEVGNMICEHLLNNPLVMQDNKMNVELAIGVASSDVHEIPRGKGKLEGLHMLASEVLDLEADAPGVYVSPIEAWNDFFPVKFMRD